jgi:hypothetical protein
VATLNFPSITPDSQEFGIIYNTQVSTTTLNGVVQTVELPGARWKGSMNFTDLTPAESATLKAFLMELRGSSGRFWFGDLTHTSPFNTISGALTVESASTARVVNTTMNNSGQEFSVGDYIQLGSDATRELKMLIDVQNVSGLNYDLTVEPMIRRTDYVGLTIDYTNPVGQFMLMGDDYASWVSRGKGYLTDISLEFIEVF